MKLRNLILRVIVSPFVFGILTIAYTLGLFKRFWQFLKYGGEWINYQNKNETKSISRIYDMLKKENINQI